MFRRPKLLGTPTFLPCALIAAMYVLPAAATPILETEPNDTIATAQSIDGFFDLSFNANIGNSSGQNTSTLIPHVEISGEGNGPSDNDFFSFTVASAGQVGIFDIDCSTAFCAGQSQNPPGDFDPLLILLDDQGSQLAFNSNVNFIDPGSFDTSPSPSSQPFLEFTFPSSGVYYIKLLDSLVSAIPDGSEYTLNVSVGTVSVPEPSTLALFALALLALAHRRRWRAPGGDAGLVQW